MAPQGETPETGKIITKIQFSINGKGVTVGSDVPPSLTLVQFLRDWAHLKGTKALCYEGGCGICTVVATKLDFETNSMKTFSVQACQTLVYACAGWEIETIEHLGNRFKGYHSLQKAVTGFYATQCGYCTPGFIMTMYGQLKSSGSLTTEQVEKSLDGNICRCTGYRPILDAFKSLASDAPTALSNKLADIEEIYKTRCPKTGQCCTGSCSKSSEDGCSSGQSPTEHIELNINSIQWYRPVSLNGLYKIIQKSSDTENIRFVVGNTGQGVYKNDGPYSFYVDTSGVQDLHTVAIGSPLEIGANVTLTRCIDIFHQMAKDYVEYRHLEQIAKHWEFVANVAVRNTGSWVGNLALKMQHREFQSDIFITLAVIDAVVQIGQSANGSVREVSIEELLKTDMTKNIIISMSIPPQNDVFIRTYKITQRAVNSHAYINAAFRFNIDRKDKFKQTIEPRLYFGGVRPDFIRATNTEKFLTGRRLGISAVIKGAAKRIGNELRPDAEPQDASPAYRISLAQSLFYKAVLDLVGTEADPEYQSGGPILVRPISSGSQTFDANKESWPIGQAIFKLESDYQVAGEAEYLDDIASLPTELHGAFVQTTVAKALIDSIDTSAALKVPGVVTFITVKDIPGRNSSTPLEFSFPDPIFVDSEIHYAGQAVGLLVAKRRDIALNAAKLIKITYKNPQKPILSIKEALKSTNFKDSSSEITEMVVNNLDENAPPPKPDHIITGDLEQGTQFHLHMEPLSALVIPKEEGFDIWATTQWKNTTQVAVAEVLGIQANRLNMTVRRLGGAYGAKITRGNVVTCAAAIAANKLQAPVRVVLPLDVNMTLVGWREPFYSTYKVGFTKEGLLQTVSVRFMSDAGFVGNESSVGFSVRSIPNVYYADTWTLRSNWVNTDTPANTWCRTPGTVEAIATIENIMEHIASYLGKDPTKIREMNFVTNAKRNKGGLGPRSENLAATKIFPMLKEQSMFDTKRAEIDIFNKEHRWKKRGMSLMPILYGFSYPPFRYSVQVAIYEHDGTVAISHGGVEMGQGINTKVAQVAAKVLGISLDLIKIKPSNNFVGANSSVTGGSYGSDLCAYGAKICCEKLTSRIDVVAKQMEEKSKQVPEWVPLIKKCMAEDVDLSERYWTAAKEHPQGYDIYGGCLTEVEVDILTGQFMIRRANLIEDCGKSLSPLIDIGQVEGSLIMGFGLYTCETVKFNTETGEKLTNGTWEYKVPTALDIPVDFRVALLPNGDNPFGVVGSKATGEPAVCLGYSIVTALRDAIKSARADAGDTDWFDMHTPLTVEKIQQLCKIKPSQFDLRNNEPQDVENTEESNRICNCNCDCNRESAF